MKWKIKRPKEGDVRIRKKFIFIPTRMIEGEDEFYIWLEYIYLFEIRTYNYISGDYYWDKYRIQTTPQFENYVKNISLYLTSEREQERRFAQLICNKEK